MGVGNTIPRIRREPVPQVRAQQTAQPIGKQAHPDATTSRPHSQYLVANGRILAAGSPFDLPSSYWHRVGPQKELQGGHQGQRRRAQGPDGRRGEAAMAPAAASAQPRDGDRGNPPCHTTLKLQKRLRKHQDAHMCGTTRSSTACHDTLTRAARHCAHVRYVSEQQCTNPFANYDVLQRWPSRAPVAATGTAEANMDLW